MVHQLIARTVTNRQADHALQLTPATAHPMNEASRLQRQVAADSARYPRSRSVGEQKTRAKSTSLEQTVVSLANELGLQGLEKQ